MTTVANLTRVIESLQALEVSMTKLHGPNWTETCLIEAVIHLSSMRQAAAAHRVDAGLAEIRAMIAGNLGDDTE